MRPGDLKNVFFQTLQVPGEGDGAFTAQWANRWSWQRRSRPTNRLPDLQVPLSTFMHSGSATDSRLNHCWCEVVKKIEPAVLVALMLWLPRGLQLPLCPISVMDELRLISETASLLSIHVGPCAAGWPPERGRRTSGTLSENSARESLKSAFFSRKWHLRGMLKSDSRRVVLSPLRKERNWHSGTFQEKHLSRATGFRVELINSVIHLFYQSLQLENDQVKDSGQKYTKHKRQIMKHENINQSMKCCCWDLYLEKFCHIKNE